MNRCAYIFLDESGNFDFSTSGSRYFVYEMTLSNQEGSEMEYSVMLDVIDEPGFEGYYYAHIPALELTTQGKGIDGALAAAKELAEVWIAEKCCPRGRSVV